MSDDEWTTPEGEVNDLSETDFFNLAQIKGPNKKKVYATVEFDRRHYNYLLAILQYASERAESDLGLIGAGKLDQHLIRYIKDNSTLAER